MKPQKEVIFDGVKYRLMGAKKYYLSQSTTNSGRIGAKGLHVAIWEKGNCQTVPKGFIVHHKDHDHFNNNLSNLELMSCSNHNRAHGKGASAEQMAIIQEKAKKWHRSVEGRAWHRQNGGKSWENRKSVTVKCQHCDAGFETKVPHRAQYCGSRCRQRSYARMKKSTGA